MSEDDEIRDELRMGANNPPEPMEVEGDEPATREKRFASTIARVEELAGLGSKLPATLKSEDDLGSYAGVITKARKEAKAIDETRKGENKPLRDEIADNDTFFNKLSSRLTFMADILAKRVDLYQDRKAEAERQRLAAEAEARREEAERLAAEAAKHDENSGEVAAEVAQEMADRAADKAARAADAALADDADIVRARTSGGTVSAKKEWTHKVEDWSAIDLTQLRDAFTTDEIEKAIRKHVKTHKGTKPLKGVRIYETSKSTFRS